MKIDLTFAEFSVVNAIRELDRTVLTMLMRAKVNPNRTWSIEATEAEVEALSANIKRELGGGQCTPTAQTMLPRALEKLHADDLLKTG